MKKILVLFLILFAVQVQAAGIYTTVARGTVASADIAVTLTAGSANVDLSSATIPRNYKGHLIRIYDANNVMIQGYVYTDGAGTVQNIVNTKGGTTRNWASQGAGFDDTTNCRYEIIKVRQAVSIAGGAVTAENERLSLVNGTAFYLGSIDCRAGGYHDGRHWARFQDSSGYVAFAKIKAEEPAGETLGSDVLAGWDFTSGWSTAVASIIDANSFSTASGSGGVYKSNITTAGYLYKITYERTTTAGGSSLRFSGAALVTSPGFIPVSTGVYYYQSITGFPSIYLSHSTSAGQTDVISMKVEAVLTPPATGALLENLAGTRNMIYAHPSFNPNAIANIQILYVGD